MPSKSTHNSKPHKAKQKKRSKKNGAAHIAVHLHPKDSNEPPSVPCTSDSEAATASSESESELRPLLFTTGGEGDPDGAGDGSREPADDDEKVSRAQVWRTNGVCSMLTLGSMVIYHHYGPSAAVPTSENLAVQLTAVLSTANPQAVDPEAREALISELKKMVSEGGARALTENGEHAAATTQEVMTRLEAEVKKLREEHAESGAQAMRTKLQTVEATQSQAHTNLEDRLTAVAAGETALQAKLAAVVKNDELLKTLKIRTMNLEENIRDVNKAVRRLETGSDSDLETDPYPDLEEVD